MIIDGFEKVGEFLKEKFNKNNPAEMSDEELERLEKKDLIAYINILKGEKSVLKRKYEKLVEKITQIFLKVQKIKKM